MTDARVNDWTAYRQMTATRPPRELLRAAIRLSHAISPNSSKTSIDLGCGSGVETLELLRQGWSVLAIDPSRNAIRDLKRAVGTDTRLKTKTGRAEAVSLPETAMVWAGVSLPHIRPERFSALWSRLVACLEPNGLFAGDFFGPLHGWSGTTSMSFHSALEIRQLCRPLSVESFISERGKRMSALNGIVDWQAFQVIARKPGINARRPGAQGTRREA